MGHFMNFNNSDYINITTDLIYDIFYSDISSRGRISSIRQYSEILIRKILDINPNDFVTIGNHAIVNSLKSKSNNNQLIIAALNKIRILGNRYTHTYFTGVVSDEDKETAFDALLDISAFLFVDYFSKYEFEKNPEVMNYFSYLPPELRYKVLNNLYEMDSSNIAIIDKLCLSIVKSKGENEAYTWLQKHENEFKKIPAYPAYTDAMLPVLKFIPTELQNITIYDTCLDKIEKLSAHFAIHGIMYENFEGAILKFQSHGKIQGNSPEIVEFNDIMELLYIGRRATK